MFSLDLLIDIDKELKIEGRSRELNSFNFITFVQERWDLSIEILKESYILINLDDRLSSRDDRNWFPTRLQITINFPAMKTELLSCLTFTVLKFCSNGRWTWKI